MIVGLIRDFPNLCPGMLLKSAIELSSSPSHAPPIVSIIATSDYFTARSSNIFLKLALLVEMVVPVVSGWLVLSFPVLVRLEYPRYQLILVVTLIPAAPAIFLLECPDEEECFSCGLVGN